MVSNIILMEDFNTLLSSMEKWSRQKHQGNIRVNLYLESNGLNKHLQSISSNSYRTHSLLSTRNSVQNTSYVRKHKKCQQILKNQMISLFWSNGIKQEINNKGNLRNNLNPWGLNMLLNIDRSLKKSKGKFWNFLKLIKMKTQHTKSYGLQQK
jgi:hypothetical protein